MRLRELEKKEVVNVCDCKKIGYIKDLVLDACCGEIEALVVPMAPKTCGFFREEKECVIPFHCIKKIGPDIILVEIHEEK